MTRAAEQPLGLPAEDKTAILNRLRRAQGQIGGIARMVEGDRDCRDIVEQLAAARKALDRAGFALINGGLRQCISGGGEPDDARIKALERLFLHLS